MYFSSFVLKNLTRRPVRTILTVLGLAVSIGSMVALLAVSHNVERAVAGAFEKRGVDLIVSQADRSSELNSDFRTELVDQARKIPGVQRIDYAVVDMFNITRDTGATDSVMVQGWDPDNSAFDDLQLLSGRFLQPGDHGKVILGSTVAKNLKKGVGDTIKLGADNTFEVVGVYK